MTDPEKKPDDRRFITIKVRRRPLYEWLLWLLWLLVLGVLLDYTLASRAEYEWQAATLAGALFALLLLAGIIANVIRRLEAEDQDKYH